LNIPTKINKGTVEIVNDVPLLKTGDRVGSSEAALLAKLNIRPFSYGLSIVSIFDEGAVYDEKVLDMSQDTMLEHFKSGLDRVTALSLAVNYPTVATVPMYVLKAFQNLLSIAVVTDIDFKQSRTNESQHVCICCSSKC